MTVEPMKFRMLLVFCLLSVGVGVFIRPLTAIFLCNPWINGVILAAFLAGLVVPLWQAQKLAKDREFWRLVTNLEPTVCCADALAKVSSSLLEPLLLTADWKVKTSFSPDDVQGSLKSLSRRLGDRHSLTRYLMGLLVLLGLLGTFLGLIRTVGAIASSLKGLTFEGGPASEAFQHMKMSIQRPLSGMQIAFSSSIFGLFGSLVLGLLDLFQRQAEKDFYDDVETTLRAKQKRDLSKEACNGPVYVLALLEQTAENLNLLQHRITQVEDSNIRVAHTWQDVSATLSKHVQKTAQNQESFDTLCQLQEGTAKQLQSLVARFGAHADALTLAMQGINRALEEAAEGRKIALRDIKSEIRVISKTLSMLTTPEEEGNGEERKAV